MSDRHGLHQVPTPPPTALPLGLLQSEQRAGSEWRARISLGRGRIGAILLLIDLAALVAVLALSRVSQVPAQSIITWKQTGGPSGGKVNILQIDPQNANVLYAGTDSGVCTSQDGGATWQGRCEGQEVRALVIDPIAPHILYAGTYAGVYRSTDSGVTWSQADMGLAGQMVFSLAVDPVDTLTIYAGTESRVLKSTDGGNTWHTSSKGLSEGTVWALAVDHVTPNVVYAGTDNGVFKSSDTGAQWQSANSGMPERLRVQMLAMDPQLPSILYAATEDGVYRSTDAAATWQLATTGIGTNIVNALVIDPNNTRILCAAVGTQGVWQSNDRGESWEPWTSNVDALVLTLAINPLNSRVIYAGTGRGVYYISRGSQSWQPRNRGLVRTNVLSLLTVPRSPGHLYATTGLDVYTTTDAGESWSLVNWGLVRPNILALAVDPVSAETLFAGTWYSEVYHSNDGGRSWRLVNGGLARDAPVNALLVHREAGAQQKDTPGTLFAGTNGGGVFASTDGGMQWKAINKGLGDLHVQVLALARIGKGTLFAGTGRGIYRLRLAGEPPDSDLLWEPAQNGLLPDEVRSMVIDNRSPNTIYAATVTGVGEIYRSTDGGDSWIVVGKGSLPTNIKIQALALHSPDGRQKMLYAGTDGGVFRSTDGGLNWHAINDGLPTRANVLALSVDDKSTLYASIQNNGVYSSVDKGVSLIPWPLLPATLLGASVAMAIILGGRWVFYSSGRAQDEIFEQNWPQWRAQIRRVLRHQNEVSQDALPSIPKKLTIRALQQYVQEHREDNLIFRVNPPVLQPANSLQVWEFLHNWSAAQQRLQNGAAIIPVVSRIAEQLCQVLGFTLLDSRSYKNLHSYVIKAPALRLKMPPMFPIVFLQHDDITEQDMSNLYDLMGIINVPSYLALLIVLDAKESTDQERRLLQARFKRLKRGIAHDFIIIGFDDLYRIFVAKDSEKRFIQTLLAQVDLTVVSPYVTSGPVPEDMFFGRDYELKTITRTIKDRNFAVVGGRKIGKTSILTNLYRTFTDSADYYPLYLDCQAVHNYRDFSDATATMWKLAWSEPCPEDLEQLVAHIKQGKEGRLIVVLLDEVDALLQYDITNQERLFKVFRALFQEGCCRFVFCGARTLATRLHDSNSALFNFCHMMRLSYLSPRDTGRIVLEPMQGMGIGFEDAGKLMQRIVDLSACHPNLVQYICQQLVLQINARGDRFIALADLDAIESSRQFSEYFVEVMWGHATALERLITLLMLDKPSFTLAQVEVALREHGVVAAPLAIEQALNSLVLCSILDEEEQQYYFAAPAFPSIVTLTQDVESLLSGTRDNLRRELSKAK